MSYREEKPGAGGREEGWDANRVTSAWGQPVKSRTRRITGDSPVAPSHMAWGDVDTTLQISGQAMSTQPSADKEAGRAGWAPRRPVCH